MKNYTIACFVALMVCSCSSNKIGTRIEYVKVDNCGYDCHRVEIYLKNKTQKRLYLERLSTVINSRLYHSIHRAKTRRLSSAYARRSFFENPDTTNYCNCKNYRGKMPQGFLDSFFVKELHAFKKHNSLENMHDSLLAEDIKRWIHIKFDEGIHFLEPNEECLVEWVSIDYLLSRQDDKYKYFALIQPSKRYKRYLNSKKKDAGTPDENYLGFFGEVAGYKLFKGRSKSNKLIIKDGKVVDKK